MVKQITIIGTGLIGGSFGLAVKKHRLATRVVGCDRADVLQRAKALGAIDVGQANVLEACEGSDLVLLSTPVGGIIDHIEKLGPILPNDALLTDVGSTKVEIVSRAANVFGREWTQRFLPGHPMVGKEVSGIENADAELFRGATWIFTIADTKSGPAAKFIELVLAIGAQPLFIAPDRQDRICAYVSHLQQFVSTAIASLLADMRSDLGPDASAIGGRALREMTRIASSPYSMWRDIAHTNTANIEEALLKLEQKLWHIRENLRTSDLREEFERANSFSPQRHRGTEDL
jgi:prephenate dehydrogenase